MSKIAVIDIDGVLNYYPHTFISFVNDTYDKNYYTLSQIKNSVSYKEYKDMKYEYRQSPYKNDAKPRDGARDILKSLSNRGYLIYIITSRPLYQQDLLRKTIEWLKKNNLYYDYIYCSQKKDFTIFEKFGDVDLVIEDNVDNLIHIEKINRNKDCLYVNIVNNDNKEIKYLQDKNHIRTEKLESIQNII